MRILDNIRPDRQTVMFSATFPRQMEALARRILKKPIEVTVGGKSVVSDTIDQNAVVIKDHEKFPKLLELLGRYQTDGQVLVFVNHQSVADRLLKECLSAGYVLFSKSSRPNITSHMSRLQIPLHATSWRVRPARSRLKHSRF